MSGGLSNSLHLCGVSVIIPCYRCADKVAAAFKSVLLQTSLPLEVIMVDDCSGDDTLDALLQLKRDYDGFRGCLTVKVIQCQENSGAGIARNMGVKIARGKYCAFLDSDDEWHPNKLEIQYRFMENNQDVKLTGHGAVVVPQGENFKWTGASSSLNGVLDINRRRVLFSNPFKTSTIMAFNCSLLTFPDRRYAEDYSLWMKLILSGWKARILPQALTCYRKDFFGVAGLSGRLNRMQHGEMLAYWDMYRSRLIPAILLCFCWCFSLMKFVRRVLITKWRSFAR